MHAGVDAVLARALTIAPLARGPADDEALVSGAVEGILQLLQARMRWPGAAQVACSAFAHFTESETSENPENPDVDCPSTALVGLLKQLYQGDDERYVLIIVSMYSLKNSPTCLDFWNP